MNNIVATITVMLMTITCVIYTIAIAASIYGGLKGFTAIIASIAFAVFVIVSLLSLVLIFMKPKNTLDV